MTHLRQLIKSQTNSEEIENLLTNYNEMVQQLSGQIELLDMVTANEDSSKPKPGGEQGN